MTINVIFTTIPFNDTEENPNPIRLQMQKVASWVTHPPETKEVNGRVMVQAIVPDVETIETVKTTLTALGMAPKIVWVGDGETGLQLGTERVNVGTEEEPSYEIQGTALYPFDLTEYTTFLRDVVDGYDAEGGVAASHAPTEVEAQTIQVNRFGGAPDRDLTVR